MRQRNKQINIRVTEKDRSKIIKLAAKSRCESLTDYILDKALNKEIIQYDLHEINAGLSKIGGELNHLVMLCHQGKIKLVNLTKYTKELEELQEALKNIK